jgi:hypothetical protein
VNLEERPFGVVWIVKGGRHKTVAPAAYAHDNFGGIPNLHTLYQIAEFLLPPECPQRHGVGVGVCQRLRLHIAGKIPERPGHLLECRPGRDELVEIFCKPLARSFGVEGEHTFHLPL